MGIQDLHEMDSSDSISSCCTKQDSSSSSSSSKITDLVDDASSSSPDNSSAINGPLFELSDLKTQLPIKRGLSKYYAGKSQSFTSLASVKNLEDLPKKENPYNLRMKLCRSFAEGLDSQQQMKRFCSPKHGISKRVSASSSFLSTMVGRDDLLSICNMPPIPIQK